MACFGQDDAMPALLCWGILFYAMTLSAHAEDGLDTWLAQAQQDPDSVLKQISGPDFAHSGKWQSLIRAIAQHYRNAYQQSQLTLAGLSDRISDQDPARLRVLLLRFVGQNHYRLGAMDRALRSALQAQQLAESQNVTAELGHIHNLIGAVFLRSGKMPEALQEMETALALFRAQQARGDIAKLENNLAVLYIEQADYDAAEPHLLASIELARELDRQSTLVSNLVNLVELRAAQGEWEAAAMALESCFNVTSSGGMLESRVYCHESATALYDRNGDITQAIANTRDALQLAERLRLGQVTLDNLNALASLLARDGQYQQAYEVANRAREKMLEIKEQALALRLEDLQALHSAEQDRLEVARLQERTALQSRIQNLQTLGLAIVIPLLMGALWLLRVRGRLLGQLRRERDRNQKLALTDALTGLANRRQMLSSLEKWEQNWQQHQQTYCLIMMDVDHFKQINDVHGHQHGDQVLKQVADAIRQAMRKRDLQGRWGGEEFLIAVSGAQEQGVQAANQIRNTLISMKIMPAVTASFGVADRAHVETLQQCLKCADDALYESKSSGRDQINTHP